jgi:hypothetical protein
LYCVLPMACPEYRVYQLTKTVDEKYKKTTHLPTKIFVIHVADIQ